MNWSHQTHTQETIFNYVPVSVADFLDRGLSKEIIKNVHEFPPWDKKVFPDLPGWHLILSLILNIWFVQGVIRPRSDVADFSTRNTHQGTILVN